MKSIPLNPYIVGNPIKSREMFFGREDDFQFVMKKIGEGRSNQIIVLCGERRSGKTSILFQILGGRLGPAFLPVLIDMQMLAGIKGDPDFFRAILKAGCTAAAIPGLTLEGLEASAPAGVEGLFEAFLSAVQTKAEGKTVLFLLDEYELIEAKIRDGTLSESTVNYLAGILESPFRVSFLFTGSTNLEVRKAEVWKILLAKSMYRKISYLSRADTYRLITEPLRDYVTYTDDVAAMIYRLTGGQPFYTQVICQNMVDLLMEEQRSEPRAADLEHVVREIIDNPLPQMIYSWNAVGEWEQIVMASLASGVTDAEGWLDAEEIVRFIRSNKILLPFKKERVNVLLDDGYHSEFLEKNDSESYRFKMDLFRRWIRREHSIWKAAKEAGLEFRKGVTPALGVGIAAGLLAALALLWLYVLPRFTPSFAARMRSPTVGFFTRPAQEAAAVKDVVFTASRGPYRLSIDGRLTLTSEGQADPRSIVVPSLETGAHRLAASLPGGETVSLEVDVSADRRAFSIAFPDAVAVPPAAVGRKSPLTAPGASPAPETASNTADSAVQAMEPTQGQAGQEMGILLINSQPPGAEVEIDSAATGRQTPFVESLSPGEHIVRLDLPGYRPLTVSTTITAGTQSRLEPLLEETWASISLDVRPTAAIFLDGKFILDTPYAKPYPVRTGRHVLTIVNEPLGVRKDITLDLSEGQAAEIVEVLK